MRLAILILAIAISAFTGSGTAMTLIQPRPPDVRLFLEVPPEKLGDLRRRLMDFAAQEGLSEFKNAPRAKEKQFFLSVYSDKYSFIAEKTRGSRSVLIECSDLDADYNRAQARHLGAEETPFDRAVRRLKRQLTPISPDISEER